MAMATTDDTNSRSSSPPPLLSRTAAKKARRKQEKADKKRQALEAYYDTNISSSNHNNKSNLPVVIVRGKASRARLARQNNNATSNNDMSASATTSASVPSQTTLPQHLAIVEFLEDLEKERRIKGRGIKMKQRMVVEVDCHGSMDTASSSSSSRSTSGIGVGVKQHYEGGDLLCDLSRSNLCGTFSPSCFPSASALLSSPSSLSTILHLDLSRNELWDISFDALAPLSSTLLSLDISRNYFDTLPASIGILAALKELRASHNLLKPSTITKSLLVEQLTKDMKHLEILDLRFIKKCNKRSLLESLQLALGEKVELKLTVTYPPPKEDESSNTIVQVNNNNQVGESPAVRDAQLLRSQLEPWSTMVLRRRLVADFGDERTAEGRSWDDADVSRGQVMDRLLLLYQEEAGRENDDSGNSGGGSRRGEHR